MVSILQLIKEHLIDKGVDLPIYYNFQPDITEDCIILWQYDGITSNLGMRPQIQISIKCADMLQAENMSVFIYDILYPVGQFEKTITINGEVLKIVPRQSPFYLQRDDNNRHNYVFNIDVIQQRRTKNGDSN